MKHNGAYEDMSTSACIDTEFKKLLSILAGRELTEREKVTAQIISNWFANKRKELKKLAREGTFKHH